LGSRWELELWEPSLEYTIDVALPAARLALEADGPSHFAANTLRPLGATALKRRLLARLGWTVVSVPLHEWDRAWSAEQGAACLRRKLARAGAALPHAPRRGGGPAAGASTPAAGPLPAAGNGAKVGSGAGAARREGDGEAGPVQAPVSVAERARRLDEVRRWQGKLTRAELLARAAARKSSGGSQRAAPD
jgi:hypothetical protein